MYLTTHMSTILLTIFLTQLLCNCTLYGSDSVIRQTRHRFRTEVNFEKSIIQYTFIYKYFSLVCKNNLVLDVDIFFLNYDYDEQNWLYE